MFTNFCLSSRNTCAEEQPFQRYDTLENPIGCIDHENHVRTYGAVETL